MLLITGKDGDRPKTEDQNLDSSDLVEMIDYRGNFREDPKPQVTTARTTTTQRTTTPTTRTPPSREQRDKGNRNEPKIPFPTERAITPVVKKPQESNPATSKIAPRKNISPRSEPPPISKQLARLRGGQKASEGYLEMRGLKEWGIVCDKHNQWTITEANIVCKQLGYER